MLQYLIARAHVVFLAEDWIVIGSKRRLASLVSEIVRIRYNALLRVEPLSEFGVVHSDACKRRSYSGSRTRASSPNPLLLT